MFQCTLHVIRLNDEIRYLIAIDTKAIITIRTDRRDLVRIPDNRILTRDSRAVYNVVHGIQRYSQHQFLVSREQTRTEDFHVIGVYLEVTV